jgi:hypothetical protein
MAEVIQRPAVPADTKPDTANNVVRSTDKPPSASKFSNSQRFVIQKLYHICAFVSRKVSPELAQNAYLSCHVYFRVKAIEEALLGRERTDCDNSFE